MSANQQGRTRSNADRHAIISRRAWRKRGIPGFPIETPREDPDTRHWLLQKQTITGMWIAGVGLLALTIVAETLFPIEPHFGFDDFQGFAAVYGFGCCVVMVLLSKGLGLLIKRREDYYDD